MGFIEGMIICFIGGWVNSFLYSYHFRKKHRGFLFWFAVLYIGGFIVLDYLIYTNFIDVQGISNLIPWINIPTNIASTEIGQYWMFTPGLMFGFPIDLQITSFIGPGWHIFALFLFLSYIWWFTIGQNLGRFMFGRRSYEKGAWYLFRSTKAFKRSIERLQKKQQKQEKS